MQGQPEIIEFLNEALSAELAAINQYFGHAKMCENWGYQRLAGTYREESVGEMRDAERLIDRILLLEGLPNMQRVQGVVIGETVVEQLEADRALEESAVSRYQRGVQLCLDKSDVGTRELLENLLVGEEGHLDWIETQQSLIEDIGIERYQQSQMHS